MNKEIINRLIGNYDKKQLKELITYIVSANEPAEELLLDYCRRKESDVKSDNHTLIIENKVKQYWKSAARIIEEFDMYWKEIAFYVSLGKEKNYVHAVRVLKEIRKIMKRNKWTNEWNGRYKTFLEEHRRKKLLLRALESIKE